MKFGITMFPNNLEDVACGSRLAEEMGFDYVGIADSQSLARELYVTLSVVAMSTDRVMLGPTASNPLTRHPAVASSAIASVYFAERFAVAGTPEECRAKTHAIFEAGVDALLITAIGPSPKTIVRRFGE